MIGQIQNPNQTPGAVRAPIPAVIAATNAAQAAASAPGGGSAVGGDANSKGAMLSEGNRAFRRRGAKQAAEYLKRFSNMMRATAWFTTAAMLHMTLAGTPGFDGVIRGGDLFAQPVFQDFNERSENDANRYVDRARRLNDADAWNNYVQLGIASEFIEWEEDALEQVRQEFANIDEDESLDDTQKEFEKDLIRANYDAAVVQWEADAEDFIFEERGQYRAESAEVTIDPITEAEYAAIVADAQAALAAQQQLDLVGWDTAVDAGRTALEQRFEDSLADEMTRIRGENAGLTGDELAAFEAALAAKEAEVRGEFELRDNFYVLSARNNYVAEKRADDASARLFADQQSADNQGDALIADAAAALASETSDLVDQANSDLNELADVPDFDPSLLDELSGDWESKMEAVVDAGLRRWEETEEQLYSQRLVWLNETKRTRAEGEAIWKSNHEKLKAAREKWLADLQDKVTEGREEWQAKFAEFADSRLRAEQELQLYIQEEQMRRDAALAQLGDMVRGGGAALLEAKDGYNYYNNLVNNLPLSTCPADPNNRDSSLYCFYVDQRDEMGASLGRFQTILGGVEGVMRDNMHGAGNATGFLNDRRVYAGTLPAQVEAIAVGDYRGDLEALMEAQSEDFLLYQRDIDTLIDRNAVFTNRVAELQSGDAFDYASAGSIADLGELIAGLDGKYDDHVRELAAIVGQDRSALPDDAARLAAIKTDIGTWFADSSDENTRLKRETVNYFKDGLGGYFLSGNENDPYLMTQAEYEWELLRRERNYLAKRLHRAEAVKRYAELAEQFEAGLELAQVTAERTDVAQQRSDLRELAYMLIKGDLALDNRAKTNDPLYDPAVRDAEYLRLLSERGIDVNFLNTREADLAAESALLNSVGILGNPTAGELNTAVADIDAFLTSRVAEDQRATHRLTILRDKLLTYRDRVQAGEDPAVLANRWTIVGGGAASVRDEVEQLIADYDFNDLRDELDRVRLAVSEPTVAEYQAELYTIRADMQTNADALEIAREDVEIARERYRAALIDFEVLRAGNSDELIRIDVMNTTRQLTQVMNYMQTLENIPGFDTERYSVVEGARIEHLYEVSEQERATRDLQQTQNILRFVQGLEEAKTRLQNLDTLIGGTNINALDALARADALIAEEANLTNTTAADPVLRSQSGIAQAFASLGAARAAYATKTQELSDAIAAGDPAATIEDLRRQQSEAALLIDRSIEAIAAGIRGEETARRTAVHDLLGTAPANRDAILDQWSTGQSDLASRAYDRGADAAQAIDSFLNTHREKTYGELMQLANAQVAAAQGARNLNLARSGYGLDAAPASDALEIAEALRNYIAANRTAIDAVNTAPASGDFDQRTVADKWTAYLESVGRLVDDADFFEQFQNGIPDSANHAWIVNYRNDRTGLQGRLNGVLAQPNGNLQAAYAALSAADRGALGSYFLSSGQSGQSGIPAGSAVELREALQQIGESLETDLAATYGDYRGIYLRETAIAQQIELNAAGAEYNALNERLGAAQGERSDLMQYRDELTSERDALDPVADAARISQLDDQIDDIADRIAVLDARIATIETDIVAPEARYRQAMNTLQEINSPASTAPLFTELSAGLVGDSGGLQLMQWTVELLGQQQTQSDALRDTSASDQVKGIIGFYETDANGEILRNSAGDAIVSAEFQALGYSDPATDLGQALAGSQTGPNLERWSQRLIDWLRESEDTRVSGTQAGGAPGGEIDPEVTAAIRQLERGIMDLLAARRMIDNRSADMATLEAQARAQGEVYTTSTSKLGQLMIFESELQNAIDQAAGSGADPIEAALGYIEKNENREILRLFAGYNMNGQPDGVANADIQARVSELLILADRLRAARVDAVTTGIAGQYATALEDYLTVFSADPTLQPPDAQAYVAAFPEISGTAVVAAVGNVIADADYRANLWTWIDQNPGAARLYRSETIAVLHSSINEGAALQAEIAARLSALQSTIDNNLTVLMAEPGQLLTAARDREVTTSVADFLISYSTRADDARTAYLDDVAAVSDAENLGVAQGQLLAAVESELPGAIFNEIRLELRARIQAGAATTADLKTALTNYLNGMANPTATVALEDDLYARSLRGAVITAQYADTYEAADYPAALREMVLVREYEAANDRYDDYLARKSSDIESERSAAALDLRGLLGDMARYIAVRDFADYMAANDFASYIAGAEQNGGRGVDSYIAQYMVERGTSPELLGAGYAELYERLAQLEYQRLGVTPLSNAHVLDESQFAGEFRPVIVLAMARDYIARNGVTFSGATLADRQDEFKAVFEGVLDDAAYAHGGESLRQRLLAKSQLEAFELLTFNAIENGTATEEYLPVYLDQLRTDGELDNAVAAANDYLPDDLTNIAGYQAADHRAMAAAIDPRYATELGRLDVLLAANGNSSNASGLFLSDAEAEAVLNRAGYSATAGAERATLLNMIRANHSAAVLASQGQTTQPLDVLRQDRVLRELLPNTADRQALTNFYAGQGERFAKVEGLFFEELGQGGGAASGSELQAIAKEKRGEFLAALVSRSQGGTPALYAGMSADQRTAFDQMQTSLWAKLGAADSAALVANVSGYETAFDTRSAQELASSGIFDAFEAGAFAYLNRAADDTQLQAARQNRNGVMRAYLEALQVEAGVRGGLSAESATLLGGIPGLRALLEAAAEQANPATRELAEKEAVLIDRYLTQLMETDVERNYIDEILTDPALLDPFQRKGPTYGVSIRAAENQAVLQELTQALLGTVADHSRYLSNIDREYARERELTNRLKDFANQVGDDRLASRFAHYRTYIGTERKYQEDDHATHIANSGTQTFDEYSNGQILQADSLGLDVNTLFDDLNWEDQLLTDDSAIDGSVDLGTYTANPDDDITVDYKRIRTVADAADRNNADYNAELEYTFKEHLANHYLEAASNLNAAFANVFNATQMADARRATPPDERIAQQLTGYDADANAGVNDLTILQTIEQDATARIAAHGQIQIGEKQQRIEQGLATVARSGEQFADAGRRNQIRTIGQMAYLDSVMRPIADEYETAQTALGNLSDQEAALRNDYALANQNHVNALNEMAGRYRNYQAANGEYELRRSIQDYAETPYLINDGEDENTTIEDWANNAREEYRRAVLVLEQADANLKTAAYNVQTQDNLTEFYAIVTGLENNETYPPLAATERDRLLELRERKFTNNEALSAAEETELEELTHREMYERYSDVITARAEHIKHTMRMVRIHKAEEIIDAEMQRRQSVLEEKKQQFYTKLDGVFRVTGAQEANAEIMAARDAVYMRMAAQAETGDFNYMNEFKAWFWGSGGWASNMGQAAYGAALGGSQMQVTPTQVLEAATGQIGASLMPGADQSAIGLWLGTGGSLAAFSGFQGVYTGYLMSMMTHDLELVRNTITQALMAAMTASGMVQMAYAEALRAVLMSNPFTALPAMVTVRVIQTAAMAQITYAQSQMIVSQAQYTMALLNMIFMGAATFNAGYMPQIYDVMGKQKEYETAQAAVDYFGKVPDMETLKERMVQWGAQHTDNDSANNLYDLTDEDLKYLFDRNGAGDAVYQTQSGALQTLTSEEESESLDVDGFKAQVTFKDAFGRRYDPGTLTTTGGPRDGNAFIVGGERYTRVEEMQNNGTTVTKYAKIIADTEPAEDAYNMGSIMDMLVQHGTDLRNDRKQRYLAAGAAASNDATFLYQERDNTYDNLYANATDQDAGGREYTGYRITHADYVQNQSDVFNAELQQRVAVQNKEWDLRAQELQDRYEEWERKMDLLMARGRSSWGNAENRFLQEWREWERKIDNDEAEGNRKWDEQIATHFEKKQQWEEDVRDRASEENLTAVLTESVNELNNQIAIANQNMGANMASISTTAYVTQILAGLENDKPSFSEKFQSINDSIKDFKTRLSVSELSGANLGQAVTAVNGDYKEALRLHAKNLKVLANVKVFEEYRKLFDGFAAQLEDQNAIIDAQTQAAAYNAGFVRSGAFFVKSGSLSSSFGVVNAYEYFDTAGVLRDELAKSGFSEMSGGELTEYLEGKDDVEVQAYFHVQKLALQRVYEVLMGKGTQEERSESQDERVIGKFGTWAGRAPGGANGESNLASNAIQAGKIDLQDGGNALNAVKYLGFAGFGEQGVMGIRPGGAPLGFYPQLEMANMLMGQADSGELAGTSSELYDTMGIMGDVYRPIEAMINQYNVPLSFMNAYKNVELASKVDGKDAGYMWEAQAIDLLKAPITMAGGAMMTAGTIAIMTGIGAPLGAVLYLGGMALNALGNSVSVDARTGKRLTKMTDQAALNTGMTVLTSTLGGAAAAAQATGAAASTVSAFGSAGSGTSASIAAAQASNAASSVMSNMGTISQYAGLAGGVLQSGAVYNKHGSLTGLSFSGYRGANAAIGLGISVASSKIAGGLAENRGEPGGMFDFDPATLSGAMGQSVLSGAISSNMNIAAEYAKMQVWGAEHSNFNALSNPGLGNVGGFLGMALSAGITSSVQGKYRSKQEAAQQRARELLARGMKNEARDALAGAGYAYARREDVLNELEYESRNMDANDATRQAFAKAQAEGIVKGISKDGAEWTAMQKDFARMAQETGGNVSSADVDNYLIALNGGNPLTASSDDVRQAYLSEMKRWGDVEADRTNATNDIYWRAAQRNVYSFQKEFNIPLSVEEQKKMLRKVYEGLKDDYTVDEVLPAANEMRAIHENEDARVKAHKARLNWQANSGYNEFRRPTNLDYSKAAQWQDSIRRHYDSGLAGILSAKRTDVFTADDAAGASSDGWWHGFFAGEDVSYDAKANTSRFNTWEEKHIYQTNYNTFHRASRGSGNTAGKAWGEMAMAGLAAVDLASMAIPGAGLIARMATATVRIGIRASAKVAAKFIARDFIRDMRQQKLARDMFGGVAKVGRAEGLLGPAATLGATQRAHMSVMNAELKAIMKAQADDALRGGNAAIGKANYSTRDFTERLLAGERLQTDSWLEDGFNAIALKSGKGAQLASKYQQLPTAIADTFAGNPVRKVLIKDRIVSRVSGGQSGRVGKFLTADDYTSVGRRTARKELALLPQWGNTMTRIGNVRLPAGTVIWEGRAGVQISGSGKVLPGGASQIWVEGRLQQSWFAKTKALLRGRAP
ncbi:MAG: hypothetical protein NXI24_24850 [bacterium]|nr:hypothetical protein [bacterium]